MLTGSFATEPCYTINKNNKNKKIILPRQVNHFANSNYHFAVENSQKIIFPQKYWNTGLVSSGASLTSWREGASLALVGNPSRDGVMIKIPFWGRCFISTSFAAHLFLLGWLSWNLALFLGPLRLA